MVSEVTVPKMPPCTRGRRGFGGCCGVIFVILLFIASCCLRGELNMPNPSEGESPTTPQNLTGTQPAMFTVPVIIPLPGKLAVKWQRLSRAWSIYEIAAQLKDPENPDRNKDRRTATLVTCIVPDALDVIDAMDFNTKDQRKDPEIILTKMEKYCTGECNETYKKYVFNRGDQDTNESVDAYVTALRKPA